MFNIFEMFDLIEQIKNYFFTGEKTTCLLKHNVLLQEKS